MVWFDIDEDPDWGGGLAPQNADPRFPVGAEVVMQQTLSGPSTTGHYELVVRGEVGRVTRRGSGRILVRMERRAEPFSLYLPSHHITPLE